MCEPTEERLLCGCGCASQISIPGMELAPDCGRTKYRRVIRDIDTGQPIVVDVYAVLEAFRVTCPARQHAIKKLLAAGTRGKGDTIQDLQEAVVAVQRAVLLEEQRDRVAE
jgi:hypothetical protein